jgi:hypothetical protein
MPLAAMGRAPGSSRSKPPRTIDLYAGSSPGLRLLFRGGPSTKPLHTAPGFPGVRSAAPPLRFRPLQRLPRPGQRHELAEPASSTACAFRFSQPLGAFIRPEPAGLVPCRIRSWGHPPELCSSRAAVRCLQRRSPLGVRAAFRVLLHARVRHSAQWFRLEPSA